MIPEASVEHYQRIQQIQSAAVLLGRRAWGNIDAGFLSQTWGRNLALILPTIIEYQEKAAIAGTSYSAATLAQQGLYEAPQYFVDPSAFAGQASDGRALESLLFSPVTQVKALIGKGMSPRQALNAGRGSLDVILRTQVADAGRAAAGVDIATRRNTGYIRMLNPPSCPRCSILAGKFYRWNAGFNRHPKCDCVHVASTQSAIDAGKSEGLLHDPYEYFNSLSREEQDKKYTAVGAQAIRDGADIFQVVNSRRGMQPGGLITKEGTSRRGAFANGAGGKRRLTPEAIYQQAGNDRAKTLRLLESNGYILPGGQNPNGVILGQQEGFGALGRGGTRVGARTAVEQARDSGVRDPRQRATMTEAERRAFDAAQRWADVQKGRNPYGRGKLTPRLAAAVETDYRNVIVLGDDQWKLTARRSMGAK